ncbi:MAG: ABC transporter permease [Treponema sp.]|jgi:lipoprotein-releasing system permease protein|nr:ABC transporter permease [Treponema sp.]
MKLRAGFFIALRYLLGRAREGGRYLRGASAGIALSLVPIIVTLIVADGMIQGITDRYLELGTGHIQVYNFMDKDNLEDIVPLLKEYQGVRGIWPERHGLGLIVGKKGKIGATIRAVDPAFWEDEGSRKYLQVIDGEAKLEADNEVLLGEELAKSLDAGIGSTVRIMTLRSSDGGRTIPRLSIFKVKGIVSAGYRELDALWCIMSYNAGKRILDAEMSSSFLLVKIDEPYTGAETMAVKLQIELPIGINAYTWKEIQNSQYSSYESTRQLLLFIMALVVMVAAVNVSAATSMLVIERQRDIAVLKTAGASPADATKVFLFGAFLTGLAGSVAGICAGLLIGSSINSIIHALEAVLGFFSRIFGMEAVKILDPGYYLETIPIIIDWGAVFLIGLFTIASSVIASWIPARRAGKLKPIEILRKY